MIDLHSHILPGVDDGAKDVETSLDMLKLSAQNGTKTVVSTSHCYIRDRESIENFISRRTEAFSVLQSAMAKENFQFPNILLGSEVLLKQGIGRLDNISKLCIENTDYILVEMPYEDWTDPMFEEIYQLLRIGLKPIIAHIDRYKKQEKFFPDLFSLNVLCQINSSSLQDRVTRKKILTYLGTDAAHLLGSDMHNLTTRPPNLKEGYDIIYEKFGREYAEFLDNNAALVIQNQVPMPVKFKAVNPIKKLFI